MASTNIQSPIANADTVRQLNDARRLALQNASLYSQIVGPVLPLVNASAPLDLQRWGSDFLSQIFSSPVLALEAKTKIALDSLALLREYLEDNAQDEWVLKSAIQAAASVYPLIFRYMYVQCFSLTLIRYARRLIRVCFAFVASVRTSPDGCSPTKCYHGVICLHLCPATCTEPCLNVLPLTASTTPMNPQYGSKCLQSNHRYYRE